MKKLYGSVLLFFYFLKLPILIGLPIIYYIGLKNNYILDLVWLIALTLVLVDIKNLLKK